MPKTPVRDATLLHPLYLQAFTEYVWLTDATAVDADLPPAQMRTFFDGVIPFDSALNRADTGGGVWEPFETDWLTRKWGRNLTRTDLTRTARPDHQILFAASRTTDRNLRGQTLVASGYNETWIFCGSTSSAALLREVLVHELTHQWKVNPSPGNTASGHCNLVQSGTGGAALKMWQDREKTCTMTYGTDEGAQGTDGVVGFHYVTRNGSPDSEFLHIRQRPEPIPQDVSVRRLMQ
jgi:hypothetical protein